jgi:formylglycine-generating enzyme required for sulfatase activity
MEIRTLFMKSRIQITLSCLTAALLALSFALPSAKAETTGADYTEPLTGMTFVRIKGGNFDMGDTTHTGYDFERPLHRVTVKEFLIGTQEVNFAQYDTFARATGQPLPDDAGWGRGDRPVINVTWDEANAFAAWLNEKTGRHFQLPTEAQWEYAARAGSTSAHWWGNAIGTGNANCQECTSRWQGKMTAPVGSFSANRFGLFDMHGNVYEWCLDRRHDTYKGAPVDGSAWLEGAAKERIQRGGSFKDYAQDITSSARSWIDPARRQNNCGFRLVLQAD